MEEKWNGYFWCNEFDFHIECSADFGCSDFYRSGDEQRGLGDKFRRGIDGGDIDRCARDYDAAGQSKRPPRCERYIYGRRQRDTDADLPVEEKWNRHFWRDEFDLYFEGSSDE
jgi:hypothetical protein